MPYQALTNEVFPVDQPWAVFTDVDGEISGMPLGFFSTEELALSHIKSLEEPTEEKDCYEPYNWRPFLGATSFTEMESYQETRDKVRAVNQLNYQFQDIMSNIVADDQIEDKGQAMTSLIGEYTERLSKAKSPGFAASVKELLFPSTLEASLAKSAIKRENGLDFPARDYAYAPDPAKPTTWQIRLTESPGKITLAQLQRAAILLSNQKAAPVPPAALNAVKRRVRAEFLKLGIGPAQLPPSIREGTVIAKEADPVSTNSFSVWKDDQTGLYHWMGVYSNNFRDSDNPPEIIKERSHKAFTYLANEGILPMPELWHWHTPGTAWGITKQLDFVDGFAVAMGDVLPGFEAHAEHLSQRKDLGMSHGMYKKHIMRDPTDPSIIDFHVTYEISDLPLSKAANKHTGFFVIKEQEEMPFSPERKEYLKGLGYDDARISQMETTLLGTGKALQAAGVESKEATPAADANAETPLTRAEVAQALGDIVGPLVVYTQNLENFNAELKTRVDALEATVKELSTTDSAKIANAATTTPAASLSEMMATHLNKGNQVAANSALLKGAAQETAAPVQGNTPSGFLNGIIHKSRQPAAS